MRPASRSLAHGVHVGPVVRVAEEGAHARTGAPLGRALGLVVRADDAEPRARARAAQYDWQSVARFALGAFRADATRAGAAALAAAMQQRRFWAGQRIGVALTGGNVDAPLFAEVLAG